MNIIIIIIVIIIIIIQELLIDVVVVTSSRHADQSCTRRFAVAKFNLGSVVAASQVIFGGSKPLSGPAFIESCKRR